MSSLLKEAIVDAKALRESALKNAETIVIEKYSEEVKDTLQKLLEQEDDLGLALPGEEPAADAGADPLALPCLWMPDGQPVDDPADRADLFPRHLGDGFRDEHRASGDLVRHPCADRGRGRADNATGGAECVHHQRPCRWRPHEPNLPRCHALLCR